MSRMMPDAVVGPRGQASASAGLSRAEKYERVAFTFCKLGTAGLLCWLLTPPIFVLLAAAITVALYLRAFGLGLTRSRCVLRRPLLIAGFWAVVLAVDAAWLLGVRW
jgi:hypothetical protein